MGSGKTQIGGLVAERLSLCCQDTDELVERRAGRSIGEIFAADGEEAFRDLEAAAVRDVLSAGPGVIALGGGAALRQENWALLHEAGALTVYLQATPEVILARVANASHRPLLAGLTRDEMLRKITRMLAEREPWYLRADLVMPTDDTISKYEMADRVAWRLRADEAQQTR